MEGEATATPLFEQMHTRGLSAAKLHAEAAGLIRLTSQALSTLAGLAKYTPGGYNSLWRDGRHITTSALTKAQPAVSESLKQKDHNGCAT
ncbi:hypothetical protein HaLaN_19573, partial [Haematococcus lacustris]